MSTNELISILSLAILLLYLFYILRLRKMTKALQEQTQLIGDALVERSTELENRITNARDSNKKDWDMVVSLLESQKKLLKICEEQCATQSLKINDIEMAILALQVKISKRVEATNPPWQLDPLPFQNQITELAKYLDKQGCDLASQTQRIDYQNRKLNKLWHKTMKLRRKVK